MTAFVIAALVLALVAFGYALRPLWNDNRFIGLSMAGSLALVAALIYLLVGTPKALDPAQRRIPDTLAEAMAQLEAELRRNPDQSEGWRLLARARAAQGQFEQARDAFAKAVKLTPDDPDLLTEAAQARAEANKRRFDDEAVAMLRHALQQQPMHQRARWFLGVAQRQAGQHAEAASTWEPLLALVDTDTANGLRAQIDAARKDAGLSPLTVAKTPPALLRITVELAPELKASLRPSDVLYVFARPAGGPPMPLAVKRLPAKDFPVTVELGDGDSLMPTKKLSQAGEVELIARISRSGIANRSKGDLESAATPARPEGDARHTLRIDRIIQ